MAEVSLYGIGVSNFVRTCRLTLEEKGVSYEVVETMPHAKDQLQRNPFGKIPALIHGDVTIFETAAICQYVDAAFDGPALSPADPVGRAHMHQWISAYADYFDQPMVRHIIIERVLVPRRGGKTDEAKVAAAAELLDGRLEILDTALGRSDYFAGANYSIADMTFLPPVGFFAQMPEARLMEGRDNLKAWLDRCMTRAASQKSDGLAQVDLTGRRRTPHAIRPPPTGPRQQECAARIGL